MHSSLAQMAVDTTTTNPRGSFRLAIIVAEANLGFATISSHRLLAITHQFLHPQKNRAIDIRLGDNPREYRYNLTIIIVIFVIMTAIFACKCKCKGVRPPFVPDRAVGEDPFHGPQTTDATTLPAPQCKSC